MSSKCYEHLKDIVRRHDGQFQPYLGRRNMVTNISNPTLYSNLVIHNPLEILDDFILIWKSWGLGDNEIVTRIQIALKELPKFK